MMRLTVLGGVIAMALAASAPADAAPWKPYISHEMGFAFAAPGDMKVAKGSYSGAVAGKRDTIEYVFLDDNIEYKLVVIDTRDRANESATLLGEAAYIFQEDKKVLMDAFGRVDRQFGRKLTIDHPNNGGRSTGAFWFINGRIVTLQATVLPANGDYDTPEMGRFIDSLTFYTVRAPDDATELPIPR
jgi:hypothetical protein